MVPVVDRHLSEATGTNDARHCRVAHQGDRQNRHGLDNARQGLANQNAPPDPTVGSPRHERGLDLAVFDGKQVGFHQAGKERNRTNNQGEGCPLPGNRTAHDKSGHRKQHDDEDQEGERTANIDDQTNNLIDHLVRSQARLRCLNKKQTER